MRWQADRREEGWGSQCKWSKNYFPREKYGGVALHPDLHVHVAPGFQCALVGVHNQQLTKQGRSLVSNICSRC